MRASAVENSNTQLAAASASTEAPGSTQPPKLTWTDHSNQIKVPASEITIHISAHRHAPSSGLHAHRFPSAIYWADGIASADDADTRSRGIPLC